MSSRFSKCAGTGARWQNRISPAAVIASRSIAALRELAMSYFNIYFNLRGERTLRRYSRPVNLARFDHLNWMTTEKPIWFIAEHLCDIPHISLLTPAMEKNLTRLDRRSMSGEMVGHRKK